MGKFLKSIFPEDKSKYPVKITAKQKKTILSLIVISLLGIFLMTLGGSKNSLSPEQNKVDIDEVTTKARSNTESQDNLSIAESKLEQRVDEILSMIEGAGKVSSKITLESSLEYEYAVNTKNGQTQVNEEARDGSNRITKETQEDTQLVMKTESQGQNEAVIIKEIRPEISGVVVVAEGAKDSVVMEELNSAVQTLLNVPAHRVMILTKER